MCESLATLSSLTLFQSKTLLTKTEIYADRIKMNCSWHSDALRRVLCEVMQQVNEENQQNTTEEKVIEGKSKGKSRVS